LNDGRISYPTEKNNKERNIENKWVNFKGGIKHIGHDGVGFAYDNEKPVHKVFFEDFSISANTVTIGDYLEFIADGGYEKPELWLSSGWDFIKKNQVNAPLYWIKEDDKFRIFKLSGYEDMDMNEPVSHISYYEADAYARWKGARLPKEEELELAGHDQIIKKNQNFMDKFYLSPISANEEKGQLNKLFGDVWEWTASSYLPYPGGKAMEGNLGEYNFKFMSNQFVLRGGSCLTPMSHFRNTYRNFYPPDKRWQMAGLRLARDSSAQ
ncbi:MAG: SUMF1/EgtB/PvdO family nonheme iron enzyme, partial [Thermoplasmataceae archaeon]